MNSLINKILCISFLIFSSLAMAGDGVSKDTFFLNSTTTEVWPDFKKLLAAHDGISQLGNLRTVTLAEVAHEYAKDEGFPSGKLPFSDFHALFKEQNHFADIVPEAEFLTQARAGKVSLSLKDGVVNSVPATPLKMEESALQAQTVEIAELKKKVEQLSLAVAKNSTWQQNWEEKIGGFFSQFNLLQKKVEGLGQEQGNFIQTQTGALKNMTEELTKKSDTVNFLATDLTKMVFGLQTKVALFEKKVNLFEDSTVTTKVLQKWFVIAGATLATLLLLIFWFMSRKFKEVQESKVSVTAFKEVKDSVSAMKSNTDIVEEIISRLQKENEARKNVVLAENLEAKLKGLKEVNDAFDTIVKKDGKQYVVTVKLDNIEGNGNRYVILKGIRDQHRSVSLKNVESALYKAANDHRLLNENFAVVEEAAAA